MLSENALRPDPTGDDPDDAAALDRRPEPYWRIEQVAARTGLTKRTLRYYEEIGLLAPPSRTEGGYRLYSERDIAQLERIKRLRDLLGFPLAEIREMASIEEQGEQVREAWKHETDPAARLAWLARSEELQRRQLQLVEEKLTGLEDMRARVLERLARVQRLTEELRAEQHPDEQRTEGC